MAHGRGVEDERGQRRRGVTGGGCELHAHSALGVYILVGVHQLGENGPHGGCLGFELVNLEDTKR